MRKAFIRETFAAVLLASTTMAFAGPLETVGPSGTHATVDAAILAVDNNGVIEIVNAGTITGLIDLGKGPANYTIRKAASVGGEVILTNGTLATVVYNQPTTGVLVSANSTRTLEGITFERAGGTGTVIDIDQSDPNVNTFTIGLTINNCIVRHLGNAAADSGEAIKLDDGYSTLAAPPFTVPAAVTLTVNNSTLSALSPSTNQKATLRVQDTTWTNLTVNLTNTVLSNAGYRTIRNDGGNNINWNIDGCTISGIPGSSLQPDGYGRTVYFGTPHNNCTVNLTNTTITAREEALYIDGGTGSNNIWNIRRCTIDNSSASTDATVRLVYTTTDNRLTLSNSVIITGQGSSPTANRGVNLQGFDSTGTVAGLYIYNNTFVGAGTGAAVAIQGTGVEANAWNNLCLNFVGDGAPTPNVMGGSYSSSPVTPGYDSDNNIIVGPVDDTSRGSNGAYILAAAGLANALTAAGLDASYKPLAGSAVLGEGGLTNTFPLMNNSILTTIGNVDRDNNPRQSPPDVGAFERIDVTSVGDWTTY